MPTEPFTRRWLSQQEAADYLGVTDRTIRNYVRTGALKGRRLPGSRLMRLDRYEIDKALRLVPSAKDDRQELRESLMRGLLEASLGEGVRRDDFFEEEA